MFLNEMKTKIVLIGIILFLLSGCFAPINLSYDNAKTLPQGEIDFQGSYSKYYGTGIFDESGFVNYNNNFGFKLGYGAWDWYTVKPIR